MGAALLSVRHLDKSLQKTPILFDVGMELHAGEIFGLIGVNGAGKTTLIKSILHLHRPEKGEIAIFGRPYQQAVSREKLQYLPEKFAPPVSLTGYEFLALTLAAYKLPLDKGEADGLAVRLALQPGSLGRKIRSYSKGMGQKLGLMSVLLCKRPLLILDEPMSGLDPEARSLLRQCLLDYRTTERCIFFSSHLLSDIEALCDRIGVMHAGRLVFIGSVADFKQRHGVGDLDEAFLRQIHA